MEIRISNFTAIIRYYISCKRSVLDLVSLTEKRFPMCWDIMNNPDTVNALCTFSSSFWHISQIYLKGYLGIALF